MDGKAQKDFFDYYPDLDLSDDEDKNSNENEPSGDPSKKVKVDTNHDEKNDENPSKNASEQNKSAKQLPFLPPPPPGPTPSFAKNNYPPEPPKKFYNSQNPSHQQNRYNHQRNNQNRHHDNNSTTKDKKALIFVKNIPQNFNSSQKLMTFFRNEGIIKQIKVNAAEQTAVVKFQKEEHAYKFLKSGKSIFNRSYIVYGDKESVTVTEQQVEDRLKDEQVVVKRAQETNLKMQRVKWAQQLAQKLRALYFFENRLNPEQETEQAIIQQEISECLKNKTTFEGTDGILQQFDESTLKQYSFGLILKRSWDHPIEKKSLFPEFLKVGPISKIEMKRIVNEEPKKDTEEMEKEANQELFTYEILLVYLSPKHAWEYFYQQREHQSIGVEGEKTEALFNSTKLKPPATKEVQSSPEVQVDRQEQKQTQLIGNQKHEDSIKAVAVQGSEEK